MRKLLFWVAMLPFVSSMAGTITTSVTQLYSFKDCYIHHSATAQWLTVSGTGLTGAVVVTAPDHFEVSTDLNKFYSSSLTLAASGTLSSTKIFVRFSPFSTGSKTGSLSISSQGSATKNVSVSGNGIVFTSLSGYYTNGATATGAALKTALSVVVNNGVKSFSYSSLYTHYPSSDTYYDGTVWDVYSTRVDAPSPFTFNHGQRQCGTYRNEGDCYNREHTMPQSWFKEASPMVSDIHHILPTDGKVNGMRSNLPFGEVNNPTYTSQQGAKVGPNVTSGYSGTVFEPVSEYKGDIARGLLFMAVRYEDKIANWSGNGNAGTVLSGNTFPAYDQWFIDLLLKWHNQDPPSNREIIRNNIIAGSNVQNNRNPFIDSPQYAQRIWGGSAPVKPSVKATGVSLVPGVGGGVKLNFKSGDGFRRLVVMRASNTAAVHPADNRNYPANASLNNNNTTGAGNYVVYNGTSSSVNVTGLAPGVNYVIHIYEYNGWYSNAAYNTTDFAIASYLQGGVAEPDTIVWGDFTATLQRDGKTVNLSWTTLKEFNNARFEVEKRTNNNVSFSVVGTIASKGNSDVPQSYSYEDAANSGLSNVHYRIRQVFMNETGSYSSGRSIVFPPQQEERKDSVAMSAFDAVIESNNNVRIGWTVNYEGRAGMFELLRSINNRAYHVIYTQQGSAHDAPATSQFSDDTLMKNTAGITKVTYQLRYTGENQLYIAMSDTQQVNVTSTGLGEAKERFEGTLYPVPFSGELFVTLPGGSERSWEATLHDFVGREVYRSQLDNEHSGLRLDNLGHLPAGMYVLTLRSAGKTWHLRVLGK